MRLFPFRIPNVLMSLLFCVSYGCGKSHSPTSFLGAEKKNQDTKSSQTSSKQPVNLQSENLVLIENLAAIIQDNQNGKLSFSQAKAYGDETLSILEQRWEKMGDLQKSVLSLEISKRFAPQNSLAKEWLGVKSSQHPGLKMSLAFLTWPDQYFVSNFLTELMNNNQGDSHDVFIALSPLFRQEIFRERFKELRPLFTSVSFPLGSDDEYVWWAAIQAQNDTNSMAVLNPKNLLEVVNVAHQSTELQIDFVKWIERARKSDLIKNSYEVEYTWPLESERMKLALSLISADRNNLTLFQEAVSSSAATVDESLSSLSDQLLALRVKMTQQGPSVVDNQADWKKYQQILSSILKYAPEQEDKVMALGTGLVANSPGDLFLKPGIYELDQAVLKGNRIEFHPFAMVVGKGKSVAFDFVTAKFGIFDLSGQAGSDGKVDLALSRGAYPIGSAQAINYTNGPCTHTGTQYLITPGSAPEQQSPGLPGESGGEFKLLGLPKVQGFLLINLQGGPGGKGAQGMDAINCVQGQVQLIGLQGGKDETQVCRHNIQKCHKGEGCETYVKVDTFNLGNSSMTYDYSQIATGKGGNGGQGGRAGRFIISGAANAIGAQVHAFGLPGFGGEGGEPGKCGSGAGEAGYSGMNGDLGAK